MFDWRAAGGAAAVVIVAGCAIGPDYREPRAPIPEVFSQAQDAGYATSAPVVSEVWSSFAEPELDALIARAQQENRSIQQAVARLDQARALRGLTVYGLLPTVTAGGSRERSEPSGRDPFLPPGQGNTTVYRAGFDASWEIDVFGGARRAAEATRSEFDAAVAEQAAIRLATVAEVAQTWFALRGAEGRLAIQRSNRDNLAEDLRILEARLDAGRGTALDTARQRTLLASVAALLPNLEAEIVRQEQRLAVLTVLSVADLRSEWLAPERPLPAPPSLVAVGEPQSWLRRRPDIAAAERRLAAATARIGVEQANFLPRLSLNGSFGYTSQVRDELFDGRAERLSYGPTLSWSFLDVGRVRQRVQASKARQREALALYDETVLRALEETENALAGYRAATEALVALDAGLVASREAAAIARARFDAGASDYLAVLDAERTQLEFADGFVQGVVARATALAALYKALAGDFARAE
ncbi:MAG TPA: efflux transporter outer membrane subunit [Steroidobacteraceae bacterium]|nr:efflux transporter outer membrane subunit [Steroidobacteraceae bacterium]HRX87984.1 efflux transporter outer membrane subunit [Steroidobacteraceae bacterium]